MNQSGAKLLLISVFTARGTSFLFSKSLMGTMEPMSILALRFMLAFLVLAVVFYKRMRHLEKSTIKGGLILGLLYTICMMFEMYGLRLLDSGVSALIENMAILFVPIYVALWTRTWPRAKTLFCAVLAIAGVGLLSISQMEMKSGSLGIFLIICAKPPGSAEKSNRHSLLFSYIQLNATIILPENQQEPQDLFPSAVFEFCGAA